jgi:hypothetical protein
VSPPPTRREWGGAVLGCALAATLFLSPALFTGRWFSPADLLYNLLPWSTAAPPDWPGAGNQNLSDVVLTFEPWLAYSAQRLHAGALPLWDPYNMLGAPLLGNMQSAVFYPPNWFYFLWPGGEMLVQIAWLKLFIAALGMYGLARQVARVGPLGAAVAAVTYTFGAFIIAWLGYPLANVAIWQPWLWWATAALIARPGPRWVAALAAVAALSILGGHVETTFHVALGVGLFALFQAWQTTPRTWRRRGVALGAWAAAYFLGAALAGAQLLPFVEYLTQSAAFQERAGGTIELSLPFRYAWTLFSPDGFGNPVHGTTWDPHSNYNESNNYIGLLPLLLVPFALLVRDRAQRRLGLFLVALSIGAAGIAYHWPIIYEIGTALPLMRIGANQRMILLMQFALALLAAGGAEVLWRRLAPRRRLLAVLAAGTGAVLLLGVVVPWALAHSFFQVPDVHKVANRAWQEAILRTLLLTLGGGAGLAGIIALGRARLRVARGLLALLPLVIGADLWQARGDYNPTIAPADYFPATRVTRYLQAQPGPFRVAATSDLFVPETNLAYGLADLRGYDALEPRLFNDVAVHIGRPLVPPGTGGFHPFINLQTRVINVLNVRYVLMAGETDPNYYPDTKQEENNDTVGEIRGDRRPGQIFTATRDNLARIEVLGATYLHPLSGQLIFHLKTDPSAPTDLVTQALDAKWLPNNQYWAITFPPIRDSQDKSFYFYFESPDAPEGGAATLWFSWDDVYPDGTRTNQGNANQGDLTFRAWSLLDPDEPWFVRVLDGGAAGASIWENRQALPRAWLTHAVKVLPDTDDQMGQLRQPPFDRAGTALLTEPLPPPLRLPTAPPPAGSDTVTITRYEPETVEIATRSPAPGLLILADQVFPGWSATVDGQPAPILTANHTLRAVYLPAGDHVVRYHYAPLSFTLGALLSATGLVIGAALLVGRPRRRLGAIPPPVE